MRRIGFILNTAVVTLGVGAAAAQPTTATQRPTPGKLLIYYAYPSQINGAATLQDAIDEYGHYDYVILGDTLQDGPGDPNPHPDHANTIQIIDAYEPDEVFFFGYVDLGVTTLNHTLSEIERRVDAWQNMGIDGIFFDDFGYDYGTTRARQNAAVDYVHSKGLPVFANGWIPSDMFGSDLHPNNPTGEPTKLDSRDYFLAESYQIMVGDYESESSWQTRSNALRAYQRELGFKMMSITTAAPETVYTPQQHFYAWYSAALYGHVATGWGEYVFAADDQINPYRPPPALDCGREFKTEVWKSGSKYLRRTERGVIMVDVATRTFSFTPMPDVDGDGVADLYDICDDTPFGVEVRTDGVPVGDLNCDCRVDLADVRIMQLNAWNAP